MIESLADKAPELIRSGVVVVSLLAFYLMVSRLSRRFIQRVAEKGGDDAARATTMWAMLRRLIVVVVALVMVLTVAGVWGISTAPFLAVGSAVGVALGFGAQDLVKDVIAGFFILAEDQYRIGDVIQVAGVSGAVEDIRPRVTVLRDLDGNVHYVPNGKIDVTTNLTQEFAQAVIDVGVGYSADIDLTMDVVLDELTMMSLEPEWSERILEEPQMLGVERLGDSAVVIRALLKVDADQRWPTRREALRRIKKRLDAEGIEIPFPQMTVHRREG